MPSITPPECASSQGLQTPRTPSVKRLGARRAAMLAAAVDEQVVEDRDHPAAQAAAIRVAIPGAQRALVRVVHQIGRVGVVAAQPARDPGQQRLVLADGVGQCTFRSGHSTTTVPRWLAAGQQRDMLHPTARTTARPDLPQKTCGKNPGISRLLGHAGGVHPRVSGPRRCAAFARPVLTHGCDAREPWRDSLARSLRRAEHRSAALVVGLSLGAARSALARARRRAHRRERRTPAASSRARAAAARGGGACRSALRGPRRDHWLMSSVNFWVLSDSTTIFSYFVSPFSSL